MPYLFSLKPNVMSCYNLQVGHTTLLRAWTFSKKIANLELNNLTWICSNFAGNNSRPLRIRKKGSRALNSVGHLYKQPQES